jgi:hypothetical protein
MLIYFFDTWDGATIVRDSEGYELPDLDAVREEAVLCARELMSQAIMRGFSVDNHELRVRDESGQRVLTLRYREAIEDG